MTTQHLCPDSSPPCPPQLTGWSCWLVCTHSALTLSPWGPQTHGFPQMPVCALATWYPCPDVRDLHSLVKFLTFADAYFTPSHWLFQLEISYWITYIHIYGHQFKFIREKYKHTETSPQLPTLTTPKCRDLRIDLRSYWHTELEPCHPWLLFCILEPRACITHACDREWNYTENGLKKKP